ncbi:PREDICTED: enolase-like [Rhagoletis zephyria]|uniref:enolase-like n=1 Tax=Rhagoletis zephyria TaxID=28612 RepID=UPI0008116C97|nr:PREDICTED: enolase-like [Rhagoletis zephyria]
MHIQKCFARQIFDSRGNPTIEVDLTTENGTFRAAVPSGTSIGVHEALELRDNDKSKYHGKSVMEAINNVNQIIAPKLVGSNVDVSNQAAVDDLLCKLDGTENKSTLGANAILGVSMAAAKAGAAKKGVPLYQHLGDLVGAKGFIMPVPAFNVINGGSHAGKKLAMQEFMILPTGAASFSEAMRMGTEVYHHLKSVIKKKYGLDATAVSDEGGFAPNIQSNKEALELVKAAIVMAGYTGRIDIGMDVAASEFYADGKYDLDFKSSNTGAPKQLVDSKGLSMLYWEFIRDYPVVSIEDPFEQDDWAAWVAITGSVSIQVVGDDLTVTNPKRIQTAVQKKACNCLLLKVNQIGTVSEAVKAHQLAKANGWGAMASYRTVKSENCTKTVWASIDTGAGNSYISDKLAKELNVEPFKVILYADNDKEELVNIEIGMPNGNEFTKIFGVSSEYTTAEIT